MQLARMIVAKEGELAALRTEFARLADAPVQLQLPLDEAVADDAKLDQPFAAMLERVKDPVKGAGREAPMLRPPVRAKLSPPTFSDRALKVMNEQARGFTAPELAMTLGAPIDSTRTLLSKLHARGMIRRGSRGEYFSISAARAAGGDE